MRQIGVDGEKCRKSRGSNKMHPAISIHLGYLTELKLNFVVGDCSHIRSLNNICKISRV